MRYIKTFKEYQVDLSLAESERWSEAIHREKKVAKKLLKEVLKDTKPYLRPSLYSVATNAMGLSYKLLGGLYVEEMRAWAKELNFSFGEVAVANCSYELSYLSDKISTFGCTAGIKWLPRIGYIHVRNFDWPLKHFGDATYITRFKNRTRDFIAVGVAGCVGILSGMLPKGYSVTINWAPSDNALPYLKGWGPSFLLRDVLEECDSFDEAVSYLQGTPLAQSVFYTICGVKRGEACVIERGPTSFQTRWISGNTLTQANHYLTKKFQKKNDLIKESDEGGEMSVLEFSELRMNSLLKRINDASSADDCFKALQDRNVAVGDTYQQMMFIPKTGEHSLRRKRS